MNSVRVEDRKDTVCVRSDYWEVEHLKRAGGAWSSLIFTNGSGKNLLRGPLSSAIRFWSDSGTGSQPPRTARQSPNCEPHGYYSETNEAAPTIVIEQPTGGSVAVVAEGTYRNVDGIGVPVGYRRRTEYGAHGLVWTTLEIMSDCGCGGAVEVRALGLPLRTGMTDAFVRFHPSQAGGADLTGGRTWLDLARNANATPFLSRFTPLQIACFERGMEGIELFPGSDLARWDCAFKPDIGLGLFRIGQDAAGSTIELDSYCMAARRMKMRVQGTIALRLGIALNEVKPRGTPKPRVKHAVVSDPNTTDAQIEQLAAEGVELIVFKDDYRDGGIFWRNGAVTPYDSGGMEALGRVIEACQRCSIKIVPYVSTHELHPETQAYEMHARDWLHSAARSLDVVHAWSGQGESGGLMCLRSGWLGYRKQTIHAILNALPWDGLCLDWPGPMPCCHAGHATGPFHSDVEELLDLLFYCRARVGEMREKGTLVFLASGDSSIIAANLADHILPRA